MPRARLAFSPILGAAIASAAVIALLGYMLPTTPARADLLIVAPHPDDDLITSAGVILRARQAGETVWVVFMTNGDVLSMESGLRRQDEAVEALDLLDVPEDNIIFLGYPDGSLENLRSDYLAADRAWPAVNRDRQTTTFGERGLGGAEYHRYIFGEAADNNGTNLRTDLTHVLSSYHPAHIFVTSEYDQHPDHRTTYRFIRDALDAARASSPTYDPTLHKTIVWNDFSNQMAWPAAAAPEVYFTEPPNLFSRTSLVWAQRESVDVPLEMQIRTLTDNLKWRAIDRHTTQGGNGGYIGQWVHKDEFFWTERVVREDNRPPVPNAGADHTAGPGARASLDGSASFDPDGDALSYQWRQAGEADVTLAGATTAQASFTVPRATAEGTVLVFELRVSDGRSTSIADAVSVRVDGAIAPEPDAGSEPPDAAVEQDAGDALDAGADAGAQLPDSGVVQAEAGSGVHDAAAGQDAATGGNPDAGFTDTAAVDASGSAALDAALVPGEEEEPLPGEEEDAGLLLPDDGDAGAAAARDAGVEPVGDAGHVKHTNEPGNGKHSESGCSAAGRTRADSGPAWLLLALGWMGVRRRRRMDQ